MSEAALLRLLSDGMEIPGNKITLAVAAGALVTILAWVVSSQTSVEVPPFIEEAFEILVIFIAGYVVKETRPSSSARETINNGHR